MLGLYDTVWWWDHLAHTVSAALVTALVYAGFLVASRAGLLRPMSAPTVVAATLGLLLVLAAVWELFEELARFLADRYGVEPFLEIYGPRDWLYDLVYNLVGAGLVLALDVRAFVSLFEPYPLGTTYVLLGVGGVALATAATLALSLAHVRDDWP
jgi:hypothetical protein